ncbi:MAG: SMC-Scp complex subunit ScpB [Rubrobacteridae bacterium]|nr:SMC-Scp complex subunit ScpB [Rubrobacteridae bacterium]
MSNLKVRIRSIVEALLFISDRPLTIEKLSEVMDVGDEEIKQVVDELSMEYRRSDRGFQIREVAGGYRMYSHPAYAPYIEKLILSYDHRRLSQAALETLSIIAYKQPVTKTDIAAVRGVNSEGVVNTLVSRGLIREVGKQDAPGLPVLYGTTDKFLESFGMRNTSELPSLDAFTPDEEAQKLIINGLRA